MSLLTEQKQCSQTYRTDSVISKGKERRGKGWLRSLGLVQTIIHACINESMVSMPERNTTLKVKSTVNEIHLKKILKKNRAPWGPRAWSIMGSQGRGPANLVCQIQSWEHWKSHIPENSLVLGQTRTDCPPVSVVVNE